MLIRRKTGEHEWKCSNDHIAGKNHGRRYECIAACVECGRDGRAECGGVERTTTHGTRPNGVPTLRL